MSGWTQEIHEAARTRARGLVRTFPGDPDGLYILAALNEIERLRDQLDALESEDDNWPLNCPYECHQIGGPWIAENPDCPKHGRG
jgi:hypothetical protein